MYVSILIHVLIHLHIFSVIENCRSLTVSVRIVSHDYFGRKTENSRKIEREDTRHATGGQVASRCFFSTISIGDLFTYQSHILRESRGTSRDTYN